MFREQPDEKREFIRTHIYRLGEEISPTLLFQITAKDSHRYQREGWREVMVSIQHHQGKLYIRYTGINVGGIRYATQKRDSEAEKTSEVNPILKAFGQAFKVFRKRPS
jgi:hypothetical protein